MRNRQSLMVSAILLAGLIVPNAAHAQTAESDQPAIDHDASTSKEGDGEIVVTARKRSESAQKVPITLSVVSGTQLQEQNLTSIQSLQQVTAGLTVRTTPKNYINLTLRGLGTGSATDVFEQSVAAFVDGTYAGRAPQFNAALFDFDRVEIIRGAQASLLSKNTSLGALSLTTRKPGEDFGFNIVGSHEFELGSYHLEAGMDIPLADNLKVRIAGKYGDQHGWVRNPNDNSDVPRTKTYGGRITLVYEPTDSLDVTLSYSRFRANTIGLPLEYFADPTGQIRSLAVLAGDTQFELNSDRRASVSSIYGPDYDRTTGDRAIATVNYDLGGHTLTSVTSYSHYKENRYFDADHIVGNYVDGFYFTGNRQWQQEVRLTSPVDEGALDYVIGASYFHEVWRYRENVISQCVGCSPVQLAAFPTQGAYITTDRQTTRDLAAFAQANLQLTDTLGLSAGIRYTNGRRAATLMRVTTIPGSVTAVLAPPFPETTLRRKENNVDGSIGINFTPQSNLLFYASISRGTKAGGFINSPTNPSTPIGAAATEYGNETATTYEVGGKWTLPQGGRLNIAFFNTDVSNFQQTVFISPRFIVTSRDLRARGVEVQASYQIAGPLRFDGSVTYADTIRTKTGGLHAQGAPKWSGNASFNVEQPVSDATTLTGNIGLEFRSSIFLTDEEQTLGYTPLTTVPKGQSYAYLNGRIGIRNEQGWEIALIGKNLTNKYVFDYSTPAPSVGRGSYVNPNIPRTIALQLMFKY